jgi:hypothetical protein
MDELLRIYRCCRDWPCFPFLKIGRCGDCGEVPELTDKTVEEYMAERKAQ